MEIKNVSISRGNRKMGAIPSVSLPPVVLVPKSVTPSKCAGFTKTSKRLMNGIWTFSIAIQIVIGSRSARPSR